METEGWQGAVSLGSSPERPAQTQGKSQTQELRENHVPHGTCPNPWLGLPAGGNTSVSSD